jgi:hypothetical protein
MYTGTMHTGAMHTGTMHTGTTHTGTMISDLIATVERVGQRVQQHAAEREELHAIFSMQIPVSDGDQVFMGAA